MKELKWDNGDLMSDELQDSIRRMAKSSWRYYSQAKKTGGFKCPVCESIEPWTEEDDRELESLRELIK